MNTRFAQHLEIVTTAHVALIAAMLLIPFLSKIFLKTPSLSVPIDFTFVAPPPDEPSMSEQVNKILDDHADDIPPVRQVKKVPADKPKQTAKVKEASKTKHAPDIPRSDKTPKGKPLTDEEIRKMMAMGARPGEQNIIPAEEDRCKELIRRALYEAWAKPSYDEVGNAVAEIVIRFQKDGSVFGARLGKKSGNNVMDASSLQAATSVRHIPGLTPAFLAKYDEISVDFKIEPDGDRVN